MTTVAIVQARMGSVRLPHKVMRLVDDIPLIELLLARVGAARLVDRVILATGADASNQPLVDHVRALGYEVFLGSDDDVLDRYYQAARAAHADIVVRITGDCPLADPGLIDSILTQLRADDDDYTSNVDPPTFPDGLDVEAFRFAALERAWQQATDPYDREHVTTFIRQNPDVRKSNVRNHEDLSAQRWTVDGPEDLDVVTGVVRHFSPRRDFAWTEVRDLLARQPELFQANLAIQRNGGAVTGTGQKLWRRAQRVIPGGSMLLSKQAEMFLPDLWPAYFKAARGCRVSDLDGREYIDMSLMGIGTNVLGYGHPDVDDAVRAAVLAGNMSTLNSPDEVYLAERLVELHPWADMVRLARSGGEADAIAVRIARAAAGREKVAVCGYHGWHDWYLAANLGDEENLAGHLLPGLEPTGVPPQLAGTTLPFRYNRIDELEALVRAHPDIGVIVMEVARNEEPLPDFLASVRRIASERGIVLVFDECTSGFRETFGGLHLRYGVEPDLAIFGKALGNGYAISAVIGRREIMEAAQRTFISSTFWTERIGPAAALATLNVMERVEAWQQVTDIGGKIARGWRELADAHGVGIHVSGRPALAGFTFTGADPLALKTLFTQEMLHQGFLAGPMVYACTEHSDAVLESYFSALDPVFRTIRTCEDGCDPRSLLQGPVCHSGFRRLN